MEINERLNSETSYNLRENVLWDMLREQGADVENSILVYHTSPNEIESIEERGVFGGGLFFGNEIYAINEYHYIYAMLINENDIISASNLFDEENELLDNLLEEFVVNELREEASEENLALAEDLITERESGLNLECWDADFGWTIQRYALRAANINGFQTVALEDEQGTAYLTNMLGREAELIPFAQR